MLAVHLVPTEMPSGLELSLSNRQAILKYDEPRSEYDAKVVRAVRDARSQNAGIATRDRHHPIAPRRRYVGWRTGLAFALLTTVGLGAWIIDRPTRSVPALDRSVAVTAFSVVGHTWTRSAMRRR